MFKPLGLLLLFLLFTSTTFSQTKIAIYGIELHKGKRGLLDFSADGRYQMKSVPAIIIGFFIDNPDIEIIDRQNLQLIKDELELQKSESFIDGYVVDQGKASGADLICRSFYDADEQKLVIRFYDVAAGQVKCNEERVMDASWWRGIKEMDKQVTMMLHNISVNCFNRGFPVVRITKGKKGKAKEALIYAGFSQRVKVDYEMKIVKKVEEKIGDIVKMRSVKIGEGIIVKIEDENFSLLKIKKGNKEIAQAIADGITLECHLIYE